MSSALGGSLVVTKESLIRDREQANVALMEFKQKYKPNANTCYLIVEGRDDIAFYKCVCVRYPALYDAEIIPAGCRKNVISTYSSLDWDYYPRNRIFFFVDRDLSEITGEYTPSAPNIYITDEYSIENSIFNLQLLMASLKVFYNMADLSEEENEILIKMYQDALNKLHLIFLPIMSWILCWKINNVECNLNNLNSPEFYYVNHGILEIKEAYKDNNMIVRSIHKTCYVTFQERDVSVYKKMIIEHGGIQKNIRGKYLKHFFVKFLHSITESLPEIFPGRSAPKPVVNIGEKNAVQILSGYMSVPETLNQFLSKFI